MTVLLTMLNGAARANPTTEAALLWTLSDRHPGTDKFSQQGHCDQRRGDRIKILYWDRDGFVLFYKRLEEGLFKLPRLEDPGQASVSLKPSELAMLLDGIDLSTIKRSKRYRPRKGAIPVPGSE